MKFSRDELKKTSILCNSMMDSIQKITNMWKLYVFSYYVAKAPGNPSLYSFPLPFILPFSNSPLFLVKVFYTESKYRFAKNTEPFPLDSFINEIIGTTLSFFLIF